MTAGVSRAPGVLALATASIVLAAACGPSDPKDTEATTSRSDGAALYSANCASRHGTDLRGTELGPSHLSIVYEPNHHPDDSFRSAIRNGVGAHHWAFGPMPPVPDLDDEEIDAIVAYVRAVQQREGFEPYPPEN